MIDVPRIWAGESVVTQTVLTSEVVDSPATQPAKV